MASFALKFAKLMVLNEYMKYFTKAGANLYSLTCELSQGNKMTSDHYNNIMVQSSKGNIILYYCIKTHDS